MGWTSGDGGRRKVVAEYNRPETNHAGVKIVPVKHKAVGDEDWFITRYERPDGTSRLEIWVMIWEGDAHKEITESSYPYYFGCPVSWLAQVPETSAEWRKQVRARHQKVDPETRLREFYDEKGVPKEEQDGIIADVIQKAKYGFPLFPGHLPGFK